MGIKSPHAWAELESECQPTHDGAVKHMRVAYTLIVAVNQHDGDRKTGRLQNCSFSVQYCSDTFVRSIMM